jgi:hypothetical protein
MPLTPRQLMLQALAVLENYYAARRNPMAVRQAKALQVLLQQRRAASRFAQALHRDPLYTTDRAVRVSLMTLYYLTTELCRISIPHDKTGRAAALCSHFGHLLHCLAR